MCMWELKRTINDPPNDKERVGQMIKRGLVKIVLLFFAMKSCIIYHHNVDHYVKTKKKKS